MTFVSEGELPGPPQVLIPKLVILCDRPSPSDPKVGFLVLSILIGTNHASGAFVAQRRNPADRLGDIFEAKINLRAHSRKSNPQQKKLFLNLICTVWFSFIRLLVFVPKAKARTRGSDSKAILRNSKHELTL